MPASAFTNNGDSRNCWGCPLWRRKQIETTSCLESKAQPAAAEEEEEEQEEARDGERAGEGEGEEEGRIAHILHILLVGLPISFRA